MYLSQTTGYKRQIMVVMEVMNSWVPARTSLHGMELPHCQEVRVLLEQLYWPNAMQTGYLVVWWKILILAYWFLDDHLLPKEEVTI